MVKSEVQCLLILKNL